MKTFIANQILQKLKKKMFRNTTKIFTQSHKKQQE